MTEYEQEVEHDYRATESFLRFLCKIFKNTHPQEFMQKEFTNSFLSKALQEYFLPIM